MRHQVVTALGRGQREEGAIFVLVTKALNPGRPLLLVYYALGLTAPPPFLLIPVSPTRPILSPVLRASALLEKLWRCVGLTMASSSERGAARREEVAAFNALVEKQTIASLLNRHARCAELSDRAASHAENLWGENSLMVAELGVGEVIALRSVAIASTSSSEQDALWRRAWAILLLVHALLLRRLADNTLLPGTNKEEEVTYWARAHAFSCKAREEPVPSVAVLQDQGALLGYITLLDVVCNTLALLVELRGSALPRESAHSFVLTALHAIPRTATMQHKLASKMNLVAAIEAHMKPQFYEPAFYAAVLRAWHSSAVTDVLRARGVLQIGVAAHQHLNAEFEARQRADIEKIGLRECAWPSCDKVKRTVREFKQCSGCRSV